MFSNLLMYSVCAGFPQSAIELDQALMKMPFQPCGASEEKRVGWLPPRGQEHGMLVESVGGQWILRFMAETRAVPAAVIQRRVQEMCKHIEATSGRKPGKKERRDLKEEAKAALLPQAFPRQQSVWVWLDLQNKRLMLDTSSSALSDDILTSLVNLLDGFVPKSLDTQLNSDAFPSSIMSTWLAAQTSPAGFTIGQECELKSSEKGTPSVRYKSVPLLTDEVRDHIRSGKRPIRLALYWGDRVHFVLTDRLQLKKLGIANDVVRERVNPKDDEFDAAAFVATQELNGLISDLMLAFKSGYA